MPCIEGLFPEPHNSEILDLIFDLQNWHAHAKLRLHTDATLQSFSHATKEIGKALRFFASTTSKAYETTELPQELQSRIRTQIRNEKQDISNIPRVTGYSLPTWYKFHALGHYVNHIQLYGTTDGFSAQRGENQHSDTKQDYRRTNRQEETYLAQIVKRERRARIFRRLNTDASTKETLRSALYESNTAHDPESRYTMSREKRYPIRLSDFQRENRGDPALSDFVVKLKNHILSRHLGESGTVGFSQEERRRVTFINGLIYKHQQVRVNYNTYDMQRVHDCINPRTHPDIITLNSSWDSSEADSHPYLYARVIGVFHADYRYSGPGVSGREVHEIAFLWVRWYEFDSSYHWGWGAKRPPRVYFVDSKDPFAFDFIDPATVLRGIHLLPVFDKGTTLDLLPPDSIARQVQEYTNDGRALETKDYRYYYVSMFSHRDLFMRFRGGGVGHKEFSNVSRWLEERTGVVDYGKLPQYDKNGEIVVPSEDKEDIAQKEEIAPVVLFGNDGEEQDDLEETSVAEDANDEDYCPEDSEVEEEYGYDDMEFLRYDTIF
ncbi:hypothetical protein VKT23_015987 [Stygiomarasmius scandens]|uniref:Uncharacterized protein n=1 Tax=Marasmiellus scandens TaxID=2682957 RepID=A0ABR1IYC3_9AGAR